MKKTEKQTLLDYFADLKWGEKFCCINCGGDNYIPGRKPNSRLCTECRYDESLIKFTAFEGLRMPLTKAKQILDAVFERAVVPVDKAIVQSRGTDKKKTLIEYITSSKERGIKPWVIDERLERIMKRYRTPIRSLAKEFEIQPNSITKLLHKVDFRIPIYIKEGYPNSHLRLINFIADGPDFDIDAVWKLFLMPQVGNWRLGILNQKPNLYGVVYDHSEEKWDVFMGKYTRDEKLGRISFHPNKDAKLEYGSKEWFSTFSKLYLDRKH